MHENLLILFTLLLLVIGCFGLLLVSNIIALLISLEIIFLATSLLFVISSSLIDDLLGYIVSLVGFPLAGAEVIMGLTFSVLLYRRYQILTLSSLLKLKS